MTCKGCSLSAVHFATRKKKLQKEKLLMSNFCELRMSTATVAQQVPMKTN